MKIRQTVVLWCVAVGAFASPSPAGAQQSAFVQGLSELAAALEGTSPDANARVGAALDGMSAALAAWDREIEAAESDPRNTPPSSSPSSVVDRHLSLARMYVDRGRLVDALAQADEAARLAPARADVQVLRGLALQELGTAKEAIEAFRRALRSPSVEPVAAYYLLREAVISGDASAAREASEVLATGYRKLLQANPIDSAQGKPQKTPFVRLAPLPRAVAGPPILLPAPYRQALGDLARGQYERAIAGLRAAAAVDPLVADPAAASGLVARAFGVLEQGRVAEARVLLEQAGPPRDSSEAHRALGLVYWAAAEYNRSVAALTTAITLAPRDERARLALARVLNAAGRNSEAEAALYETARLIPDSVLAHWWLTLAHEQAHRAAEAREEVAKVAAAAVFGAGQLYAAVGRFALEAADNAAAIEALARALHANPNDATTHRLLANTLLQEDRVDAAFGEFMAVLLIDPLDATAHAGIGQIYVQTGRDADAVDALRRATDLAPDDGKTRYALASALERLGRGDEAARHFARVEQAQRQTLADRRRELSAAVLKQEATLHAAEGRFDTAIALYEKALAVEADPLVYTRLADLYAKIGRPVDAARAKALAEKAQPAPAGQKPAQ